MRSFFFTCLLFANISLFGQTDSDINVTDFIREAQQWVRKENRMTLTWWIPNSYWNIIFTGYDQIPRETIDQLEETFADYIFICAEDILIDINSGTMKFTEESSIRKSISIIDINGNSYFPISKKETPSFMISLVENIKPIFSSALGQMGEGLNFFFFKILDANNKSIINEKESGGFIVKHSNCEFKWTLPMLSLLPPKYCPIDNEKMKGNWLYCPIHGVKLNN
jgi:hypothetical protein